MGISVETRYLAPSDSTLPALVLQVTRLDNSYMLWVGTTDGQPDDAQRAPSQGALCKDWACAMPPKTAGSAVPATSLFRSPSTDAAISMAQRLARRFKKQVFLSVDVPASFGGQRSRILLEAEKGIVATLAEG